MNEIKFTFLSDPTVANIKWQGVRLLLDEVLNVNVFKGSLNNRGGVRNPPLFMAFRRKWDLAKDDKGFRAVIAIRENELLGFILYTKCQSSFVGREIYKQEIFTTATCTGDYIFFDLGLVDRNFRNFGIWRGMMSFLCTNEKWCAIYGLTSPFNAYVLDLIQSYGAYFIPTGSDELVWRCRDGVEPFYNNFNIGWICFEFQRKNIEMSLCKRQPHICKDITWLELWSIKTDLGDRYAVKFREGDRGVRGDECSFLLDRISGYALCTNKISDIRDAPLRIPVFDYNDFRSDVLREYDVISERVQKSSYEKIHDLVEDICKRRNGKEVELVDICGGNSSLWNKDLSVNSMLHDARNGKCIDINNFTEELCLDVKSADLILMVNALARLYNYVDKQGRDYTQQEKKAFLRNICQLPGENEQQTLCLLESICSEGIGYLSIKGVLEKLHLFQNEDCGENWAAFWWYALAEKFLFPVVAHLSPKMIVGDFVIDSATEVVASTTLPNRKVLLYSMSRRGDLLYKVMFQEAQSFFRQLTFIKSGIVSEEECRTWLKECNEQIGPNRLVDQLKKYRTFHAINDEDTTFTFIITTTILKTHEMDLIAAALLAKSDVIYYLQTDGSLYYRSRFGNELEGDPICGCGSLLTATFEFLRECLRNRFPYEQRSVLSISVGKYSSLSNGFSTLSANYFIDDDKANDEVIFDIVRCLFGELDRNINNEWRNQVSYQAISSAIGSIMSRNGSHNIGSHVLAALSHNVGTMPDDRVLYQYIQHRMDYIATVTTDFPTWTQPTNFVGSLLRTFLEQRHLLDHITESEGLSAWQFQNLNLTEDEWKNQHDRLQFFVRRRKKDGSYVNFITYKSSSDAIPLKYDVALAIPGGTVGQHAFYTILENIIRNAAKHDWSVAGEENRPVNLPLYIDFEDDDNAENVVFEIWTKVTPIEEGLKPLTGKEVSEFLDLLDENVKSDSTALKAFQALPVQHWQQVLIERSFIGSGGNLWRENWGLAEMKISAGYLQRRSVSEIGGIAESNHESANAIILPCLKEHEGKHYLCYRFSVPKPREVLVIVDDDLGALKPRIDELRNFGVFVKNWSAIVGDANERARELNYRFVIHPNVTLDVLRGNHVKFPFRVLSGCEPDKGLSRHIPRLENYKELVASLLDSRRNIGDVANDLLTSVYRCWCQFLTREEQEKTVHDKTSRVIVERTVGLVVAPNEGGSNCAAGRSLIADADVLKFLLRESFSTCVDQFLTLEKYDTRSPLAQLLRSLKLPESAGGQTEYDAHNGGFVLYNEIARQLSMMLKAVDLKDDVVAMLARKISDQLERFHGETKKKFDKICRSTDSQRSANKLYKTYEQASAVVAELLEEQPIGRFIQYLAAMHRHTAKLFKQYEEKIVSLPKGYSLIDSSQKKGNEKHKEDGREVEFPVCLRYEMPPEDKQNVTDIKWIAYRRHDYTLNDKLIYAEPLSGTQSYLSQLMQMQREVPDPTKTPADVKNLALITRLVENGLMKLLVIDERVAKFVREHADEVAEIYHSMNITVVDDKADDKDGMPQGKQSVGAVGTIACFADNFHKQKIVKALTDYVMGKNEEEETWLGFGKALNRYDMLIVHQGILDKWFPKFKRDPKLMQKLIKELKKVVRYVIITTGRGTPPNIPEDAHLIPFAVVESALFRKHPEKLILVDTVMNVVPVGKMGGEEDV